MSSPQISSNRRWSEPSSGMFSQEKWPAITESIRETSGIMVPALWLHFMAGTGEQLFSRAFECASIQSETIVPGTVMSIEVPSDEVRLFW